MYLENPVRFICVCRASHFHLIPLFHWIDGWFQCREEHWATRFSSLLKTSSGWKCVSGQFRHTAVRWQDSVSRSNTATNGPERQEWRFWLFFKRLKRAEQVIIWYGAVGKNSKIINTVQLNFVIFKFILLEDNLHPISELWSIYILFSCLSPFPGFWCLFREIFQHRCS